jgi:hypothetical protein
VTQADVDAGSVTNTGQASGTSSILGPVSSNTSTVTVSASDATGTLSLVKSSTPVHGAYSAAGNSVAYSYLVTNTGSTTISGIGVSDTKVATVHCPDPSLAPGASETCTGSYTVTQADVDAGTVTNSAQASGSSSILGPVSSNTSTLTVYGNPQITSANTTTFIEGDGSFQVTANGADPITYTETGTLPKGVTLSPSGLLSGTPGHVAAEYPITIKATDANGDSSTQAFDLYVEPSPALAVVSTSVPNGTPKVAYSDTLVASGGTPGYKWKMDGGSLPKGLHLSAGGKISGKPTATAHTTTFTVKVTDHSHPKQSATATFTLTIT